jgi:hypothetical protein
MPSSLGWLRMGPRDAKTPKTGAFPLGRQEWLPPAVAELWPVATRGASAAPATGWLCVRAHGDRGVVAVVSSCLCGWQALVRVGNGVEQAGGAAHRSTTAA